MNTQTSIRSRRVGLTLSSNVTWNSCIHKWKSGHSINSKQEREPVCQISSFGIMSKFITEVCNQNYKIALVLKLRSNYKLVTFKHIAVLDAFPIFLWLKYKIHQGNKSCSPPSWLGNTQLILLLTLRGSGSDSSAFSGSTLSFFPKTLHKTHLAGRLTHA